MTGRKSRVLAKDDGSFVYEPRSKDDVPLEILNVAEKKRFMNEEKVPIFNFYFKFEAYIFECACLMFKPCFFAERNLKMKMLDIYIIESGNNLFLLQ